MSVNNCGHSVGRSERRLVNGPNVRVVFGNSADRVTLGRMHQTCVYRRLITFIIRRHERARKLKTVSRPTTLTWLTRVISRSSNKTSSSFAVARNVSRANDVTYASRSTKRIPFIFYASSPVSGGVSERRLVTFYVYSRGAHVRNRRLSGFDYSSSSSLYTTV